MSEDIYQNEVDNIDHDDESISDPTELIEMLKAMQNGFDYTVENVADFPADLSGKVIYDKSANKLYLHLPDYIKNYKLNHVLILNFISSGYSTLDFFTVAEAYEIDESKIFTCKHFVPSSQLVELGSKLPSSWKFTEAPNNSCCTHHTVSHLSLKAHCHYLPNLSSCPIYSSDEWVDLKRVYDGQTLVLSVQQSHTLPRVPKYRVTFNDKSENFDDFSSLDSFVTNFIASSEKELMIVNNTNVVHPYIETILS